MKKLVAIFGIFLVTACAQYTASDKERAGLSATLESKTESYLQCIRDESRSLLDISSDVAFIADRAKVACDSQLEGFKAAQTELLQTQYILTTKKVEESVARLDDRSKSAVSEMLVNDSGTTLSAKPAMAAAGATSAPRQVPVPSGFSPSFEQRVYMDCIGDQVNKYVSLNETAAAIAEVAASRCRPHLTGANQAALEQEGRALVMGTVFDARLSTDAGSELRR